MILDRRLPPAVTLDPRSFKTGFACAVLQEESRVPAEAAVPLAARAEPDSTVVAPGQQRRPRRRARLHRAEGTQHSETRPVPTRQNSRFWMCPTNAYAASWRGSHCSNSSRLGGLSHTLLMVMMPFNPGTPQATATSPPARPRRGPSPSPQAIPSVSRRVPVRFLLPRRHLDPRQTANP